jgi:hypothetical protein
MKQFLIDWWNGMHPKSRRTLIIVGGVAASLVSMTLFICLTITGDLGAIIAKLIG